MKLIYKIFTLIALLLVSESCSDDQLIENPPHIIAPDNLYVDLSGFEAGLNGLYARVRLERAGINRSTNDLTIGVAMCGTDIIYGNYQAGIERIFNEFGERLTPSTSYVRNIWEWLYEIINGANTIITRSENPDIDWTEAEKQRVVGEARLIRAWAYRHLTFLWGDVPLNLEEAKGSNIKTDWERAPIDQIHTQMEDDWLFAAENLPETSDNPGKLVKAVAQHYLAELYLTTGQLEEARQMAETVINNSNFSLVTERYGVDANQPGSPFTDMFIDGNSNKSEGNTEALWVLQNELETIGGDGYNIMRRWYVNRYYSIEVGDLQPIAITVENGGRGLGRFGPTNFMIQLYEAGDDRGSEYAWRHYWTLNDPDNIPEGYQLGDTIWLDTNRDEMTNDPDWPNTRKWDSAFPGNVTESRQYNDQVYLRLGETYLLLAEAQLKLGDAAGAAETINILRRRANASEITAADVDIDFILDERARELYSEEHRRYALLRNNKWMERTQLHNKIAGDNITDRDKLMPIPQDVIDANLDLEMRQNPGYSQSE